MIQTYRELSSAEKIQLHTFLQEKLNIPFPDAAAMEGEIASPLFADGTGLFVWREGESIGGTLGVISKELADKGEVYITWLSADPVRLDVLDALLAAAQAHCDELGARHVRLGVGERFSHLREPMLERGFRPGGDAVILKKAAGAVALAANVQAVPLGESNQELYLELRNPSFALSPNSSILSAADVRERALAQKGDLCGILYFGDVPVGTYEVSLRDKTGVVEEIAVAREQQGKGYGQLMLDYVQNLLAAKGADYVEMLVITSNAPAMGLYLKNGFEQERRVSMWFDYAGTQGG
jgi:ribosomal protein S18 acetylase RimI-like enzyme